MRSRVSHAIGAAFGVVVLVAFGLTITRTIGPTGVAAQASQPARPARIEGKPNINGIWQVTTTANWDLLAHDVKPAVAQRGVYANHPVLAAPVVALGSAGIVPPGPGVVEGNEIPYKPDAAKKKEENRKWK